MNLPNYSAASKYDDGSCNKIIEGCTDLKAWNFKEEANTDDGSCKYGIWYIDTNHDCRIENADIKCVLRPNSKGEIVVLNDDQFQTGPCSYDKTKDCSKPQETYCTWKYTTWNHSCASKHKERDAYCVNSSNQRIDNNKCNPILKESTRVYAGKCQADIDREKLEAEERERQRKLRELQARQQREAASRAQAIAAHNRRMTSTPASTCYGFNCSYNGQICPAGRPGAGPYYYYKCQNNRWVRYNAQYAASCRGWNCPVNGQCCPHWAPGAGGRWYQCHGGRWK